MKYPAPPTSPQYRSSYHSLSSNESPASPPMEPNPNYRLSTPSLSLSPPWSPPLSLSVRRYPPYPRYERSNFSPPPLRSPIPINDPMLPAARKRQFLPMNLVHVIYASLRFYASSVSTSNSIPTTPLP